MSFRQLKIVAEIPSLLVFSVAQCLCGFVLRRVRANRREECFAEIVGLARADPLDRTQRVERVGPQPGHLTKRGVVKDDVGWDAPLASHLEPHCAEALEESS